MSSLRSEQQVFKHFTHIHPLTKVVDENCGFICDGCKTPGYVMTYRCSSCDYDLHEYCTKCPPTLLSFLHPQHELQLVVNPPKHTCDFCHELVEGFYYRCNACDFDVHPLCTQMPQYVSYVSHPAHALELSQSGTGSTCVVCQGAILSWRYKCSPCMLNVHMECVNLSAADAATLQQNTSHTNKGGPVPSKTARVVKTLMHLATHAVLHVLNEM